jgi:outer membrane protein assembly factor BamA
LRLVGRGLESVSAWAGPRYFDPKPPAPPHSGPAFSPRFEVGGVKDVSLGPGLKWNGFPTGTGRLDAWASLSTVDRRRARVQETIGDRRPLGFRLRADYDYRPDRRYYGIGNETEKASKSYYLLATSSVDATLLLGSSPVRQVRFVGGYSSMSPRRGYFGTPLLEDVFAPVDAPFEHRTTREFSYGVTGDLAALDDARDPSRGVHGRWDLRRAMGQDAGDPDYDQWRVEARAYLPVFAKRRVLALRGIYAGIDPRGSTTTLPYYRLMTSDGVNAFAGYASERFRDRQLLLGRVEYRWTILYRVSAIGLYELGEVAPRAGAFRLSDSHRSYGGGFRLGLSDRATARFELAKSSEGLHAVFVLGGDF